MKGIVLLLALPCVLVAQAMEADAGTRAWIASHGSDFASLDRGDLGQWHRLVGSARVIGLGEQTHGTHEFITMKHRLVRDGVNSLNVRVVAFEDSPTTMAAIDSLLHTTESTEVLSRLDALVMRMAPQWRTVEVQEFLFDMHLQSVAGRKFQFIGVDSRGGPPAARDSIMAENTLAALAKLPDSARVMLWSHNIHVGVIPNRLGFYLHQRLGARYVALGFATAEGTYRAHAPTDSARQWSEGHTLKAVQPGSVESAFMPTTSAAVLYDVRGIVGDPRGSWLNMPRNFHHEGSNVDESSVQVYNVGEAFDGVLFIPKTSTAHGLAG